jgi:hypothetical protein
MRADREPERDRFGKEVCRYQDAAMTQPVIVTRPCSWSISSVHPSTVTISRHLIKGSESE